MQLCKYFLLATGQTCCNINLEGEEETEKCMEKQTLMDYEVCYSQFGQFFLFFNYKKIVFKQKQTKNIFHFSVTVLGNVQVTKSPQNKMQSIVFFALLVLLFGLPAGVLIRGNLGLLLFLLVM